MPEFVKADYRDSFQFAELFRTRWQNRSGSPRMPKRAFRKSTPMICAVPRKDASLADPALSCVMNSAEHAAPDLRNANLIKFTF